MRRLRHTLDRGRLIPIEEVLSWNRRTVQRVGATSGGRSQLVQRPGFQGCSWLGGQNIEPLLGLIPLVEMVCLTAPPLPAGELFGGWMVTPRSRAAAFTEKVGNSLSGICCISVAGSSNDNLPAGLGHTVQGVIAQNGVVEEAWPIHRRAIGRDDQAGGPKPKPR